MSTTSQTELLEGPFNFEMSDTLEINNSPLNNLTSKQIELINNPQFRLGTYSPLGKKRDFHLPYRVP